MKAKKHIIIIGANFAGLNAAREVGSHAKVTLIDPNPWFEFFPNIHELLSGVKTPEDLRLDRGQLIREMGHTWKQDRVVELKPDENKVITADGTVLTYDACVFAIGGVNDYHGVKGAAEHSLPFKSVEECERIGKGYQALQDNGQPFTVVIAGGGSEGVEALGELLRKRTPKMQVHLVEARDRLLPAQSEKAHKEILRICKRLPVEFHFNTRITQVDDRKVVLSDGREVASDLTIWTGGVKPHPLLHASGISKDPGKWAPVKRNLQSEYYDNIFVTGDAADLPGPDSKQAYFALETGTLAGRNVVRMLKGAYLFPYEPVERPALYSFGNLTTFLLYRDFVLAGRPLAAMKEGIYQKSMLDVRGIGACNHLEEAYDRILKGLIDSPGSLLNTFLSLFTPPFDLFLTPSVQIL